MAWYVEVMDATHDTSPGTSNCAHCAAAGGDRQWNPRTLRQGLCGVGYRGARAAGTLPVKRLPKGQKRQCTAMVSDDERCPEDAKAHGLCPSHVARLYRGADVNAPLHSDAAQAPGCTFGGCTNPTHADGLCAGHTSQQRRGKPLTPLRSYRPRAGQCEAVWKGERCPRDVANDGLCRGHYDRKIKTRGAEGWDAPIRPKGKHGEGYITDDGYKIIYVNGRKVREHVYVMEQEIGRKLLPKEQVHHLRGGVPGRSNNALDNLELWTKQHPTGHRVVDVITYTFEQQALYLGLMDADMLAQLTTLGQQAAERLAALAAA